jgi:hypothetical protein
MHTSEKTPPPPATTPSRRRTDLERFEAQLAEWTALIGQYRAAARRADARVRLGLDRITDDLQFLRNEASAQFLRLKSAADAEWESERERLERSWQAVQSSFRRAEGRF